VAVAAVVGSVVTRHAAADVVLTDADLCDTYSGGLCTIASMKVLNCSDACAAAAPDNCTIVNNASALAPAPSWDGVAVQDVCNVLFNASVEVAAGGGLTCVDASACQLVVNVTGHLGIAEAVVAASTVIVNATSLAVGPGSSIHANGLGWPSGPGAPLVTGAGAGGSHGGGGGMLPCSLLPTTTDLAAGTGAAAYRTLPTCCANSGPFLSYLAPYDTYHGGLWAQHWPAAFGSGGNCTACGRGGGRVALVVAGAFTVDSTGFVSADGGSVAVEAAGTYAGAGAGGSVVVSAGAVGGHGIIHANGGPAPSVSTGAAGGGGRVAVLTPAITLPLASLAATGGWFSGTGPSFAVSCYGGGAGTVWVSEPVTRVDGSQVTYNQLRLYNGGHEAYSLTRLDIADSDASCDAGGDVDPLVLAAYASVASSRLCLRRALAAADVAAAAPLSVAPTLAYPAARVALALPHAARAALLSACAAGPDPACALPGDDGTPLSAAEAAAVASTAAFAGISLVSQARLLPRSDYDVSVTGSGGGGGGGVYGNLTLSAGDVQLLDGGVHVWGCSLSLDAENATLGASLVLNFAAAVVVRATHSAIIQGTFDAYLGPLAVRGGGAFAAVPDSPSFIVWAGASLRVESRAFVTAPLVGMYCDGDITVTGRLEGMMQEATLLATCIGGIGAETCDDVEWRLRPTNRLPPSSNYSLRLVAPHGAVSLDLNSEVYASAAIVCGMRVSVLNVLSAAGGGCESGDGPGAGQPGTLAGGGGGHAGGGGASGDGGAGGRAYDSAVAPVRFGSGGGSMADAGGTGGGYLSVNGVNSVLVDMFGTVAADGDVSEEAGGGGAGGTVVVRTFSLTGTGTLSTTGGAGLEDGGGGSGGMIMLQTPILRPTSLAAASRALAAALVASGEAPPLDTVHDTVAAAAASLQRTGAHGGAPLAAAARAAAAVLGARVEGGGHRSAAAASRLRALRATAQAAVAAPGAPDAEEALAGAILAAVPDSLGSIADSWAGFILMDGGLGEGTGAAGGNGSIVAPPCPPGYGGVPRCSPCGTGWYPNVSEGIYCTRCTNAPSRAVYTAVVASTSTCPYACPAGTLYPTCDTPFESMLALFGGPIGFASATVGAIAVIVLFLILLCCRRRSAAAAFKRSAGVDTDAVAARRGWRGTGGSGGSGSEALLGRGAGGSDFSPLAAVPGGGGANALTRGGYGAAPAGVTAGNNSGGGSGGDGGRVSFDIPTALGLLRRARGAKADATDFLDTARPRHHRRHRRGGSGGGSGGGSSTGSESDTSGAGGGARKVGARTRSSGGGRGVDGLSRSEIDLLVACVALAERDVPRHVCRIYLGGTNTFGAEWAVPATPPPHARRYVHAHAFARMAARANAVLVWPRWGWEEVVCLLLAIFAFPLSTMLHRARKRVRVARLLAALLDHDASHEWLRGARHAALLDSLRVGVSSDSSLAYIDILGRDPAAARKRPGVPRPWRGQAGAPPPVAAALARAPRLPLALLLAGDGTFESPLFLDPNDVLVRAVATAPGLTRFIDHDWLDFVAEFNGRARAVAAGATVQTAGALLALLEVVNGEPELLGGLQVRLVRYWPCATPAPVGAATGARPGRAAGASTAAAAAAAAAAAGAAAAATAAGTGSAAAGSRDTKERNRERSVSKSSVRGLQLGDRGAPVREPPRSAILRAALGPLPIPVPPPTPSRAPRRASAAASMGASPAAEAPKSGSSMRSARSHASSRTSRSSSHSSTSSSSSSSSSASASSASPPLKGTTAATSAAAGTALADAGGGMLDRFRHGSFGSDEEAPNGVGGGGDSKGVPAPAAATFPATADEGGEYGDDGDGDGDVWDTEGDTESQLTAPAAWAFFSLAEDVVYLPGSRLGLLITHPLAPSPAVPPPPAAAYVPSTRMLPPPAATSAAASAAAAAISALSPRLSGAAGGGVSVGGGGSSYVGHDDGSLQLALAIDDEGGALVMHSDTAGGGGGGGGGGD